MVKDISVRFLTLKILGFILMQGKTIFDVSKNGGVGDNFLYNSANKIML